ncbi:MAG TPA: carbon starvation CstA family protein, partial [Anaeromyxobacteraceae bacterium]|nr:carbon starvation CstA family protein [Anaeromyxobacteraceae bacterium]
SYTLYGRFVAKQYVLDDTVATPAVQVNDGVDFVPTKKFFLLGQHFSAIAAAGPIAGPILACQLFGWGPSILWIALGVVFIGAVHDFSALVASVRHKARSVAEIVKENMGRRAWLAMMAFMWIALVYLIIAFADITAATFVGKTEEFQGTSFAFNPGGAVAIASGTYMLLAIVMGLIQRKWDPPLWLMTVVFVPATLGAVWLGTRISTLLIFSQTTWAVTIMVYCFVASLLPVWLLLQPRGYLGGFVLYMALAVGIIGIFFGGFDVKQPITTAAPVAGLSGSMLPFLFVTIACGACSGFHGLVASGTTSKQLAKETDARAVGYGGMLLEGFVALIALATIMIAAPAAVKGLSPGRIYGDGIARFLTVIIGEDAFLFAATFGAMAFSTFVFDTLDVATRLGRYILQELANVHTRTAALVATGITAAVPAVVLVSAGPGGYRTFWTLFGTSNQLLAALTLLGITVWLKRLGRRVWYTAAPMVFLLVATLWSLLGQALQFWGAAVDAKTGRLLIPSVANAIVAVLLFALTAFLLVEAWRAVQGTRAGAKPVPGGMPTA